MSRLTKWFGLRTGKGSDKYLSPSQPYTGNGHTKRDPHDEVRVVTRDETGKPIKSHRKK